MTELEMTVEALKKCIPGFKEAMEEVRRSAPPESKLSGNRERVIQDLLLEAGMPANVYGYRYATKAISLLMDDAGLPMVKGVYTGVAEACGATADRVERGIRHGIEQAVMRCDQDGMERYFGNSISAEKGKPTNAEFLRRMAMEVRRRMGE